MQSPLVSVICLSHNHSGYVEEAIRSVLGQDHDNVELIVVDDGSMDGSKETISKIVANQNIRFIDIPNPIGNCKAFNKGLWTSNGEFIIDLAADDFLLPNRISAGLQTFERGSIGIEYCNVMNISPNGKDIHPHFSKTDPIPQGDIYIDLIERYFISPPGMMIKREVLESLNGYDETLSYEDFDFWIRSGRHYRYGYTDQILVKKRILPGSLSKKQFQFRSRHQKSTLEVCRKIRQLNRTRREKEALTKRSFYEIKNCIKQGNLQFIPGFLKLMI